MMVMVMSHLSVVGSGPIRQPLKSSPSRYLQHIHYYPSISRLPRYIETLDVAAPDECRLPRRVLAHQQHAGLAEELCLLQGRAVQGVEQVSLLERPQRLGVVLVEALLHRAHLI